jgi:glucokinase
MAKCCIGIDLGGTFIKFVLLDENLSPSRTIELPTSWQEGPAALVGQMVAGSQRLMEKQAVAPDNIVAVGIGSPGPIDIAQGLIIEAPNIPGMRNFPLRDSVSRALGLPAVLENDANAAAYGEYVCGAGRGSRIMVMLTLGTGVGSGIIIDGRILHGSHGLGGELGHMIVVPDGEPCGCGQKGCLERYCSATYLAMLASRKAREEGRQGILAEAVRQGRDIDARAVNEARKAGDALAGEVWDMAAYHLAIGCVNICRIFDPEIIVLSGGLTRAGEDLLRPLEHHFNRLHWRLTEPRTRLAIASLGADAGAIGAAGVAWRASRQQE